MTSQPVVTNESDALALLRAARLRDSNAAGPSHPNIMPIYAVRQSDSLPCFGLSLHED